MDHGKAIALYVTQRTKKVFEQCAIQAGLIFDTGFRVLSPVDPTLGHAATNAFAISVVAKPMHIEPSAQGDIDEVIPCLRLFGLELRSTHVGKKARHRNRG